MRRFCVYTRLQLKRVLHHAPFLFFVTLVICLALVLAIVSIVSADNSDTEQTKVEIGVVGDFENTYLSFGIQALKSFDSSRFFLDIVQLDEVEARKRLLDKELAGYVVIPDGFVENAIYGDVGKLSFVTTATNADIVNMFKQEVLELVSCILVESQNGVYGMQDAMLDKGISYGEVMDKTEKISFEYVDLIINRSNALDIEIIDAPNLITFGGYMFSGISILLILLSGIVCCAIFIRQDYALPRLMSANRYGVFTQTVGEYLSFFAIMALNTLILLFFMMLGVGAQSELIRELAGRGIGDILPVLIGFLPAVALITSLQFLLYQLSDSLVSGVLIQFVSAVLLGYVSGCFYPITFFPKAIRFVSGILPSGIAREYLSSLILGNPDPKQISVILVYTVVLLVISGIIRDRRIREA